MDMPTVIDAAGQIRRGERSAVDLMEQCLAAVERHNPSLNAFVHLDPELALAAAECVDDEIAAGRADALGPLAGVPFGVKDLEDCAGMPTTRGSLWFAGGPPAEYDEIHVCRLRAAGAIPIGKTAAPEFGAWAYTASPALGVTRNPWNTDRTPGGSSGGSSAAVSVGMTPFCTASDGGGSIRTPASFTGLVGLKNSFGRIPTRGVTHLAQNAVVGSLATTVGDVALLLDVMAGPDPRDRTCLPSHAGTFVDAITTTDLHAIRVGWSLDLGFAVVDPEVAALCNEAARALAEAMRAPLSDAAISIDDYIMTYARVEGADQFVGIDPDLWQHHLDRLDPLVAPGWAAAARVTLPQYAVVEQRRRELVAQVADAMADIDILVTPMSARPPFDAAGPMPTDVAGVAGHAGVAVIHGMLANLCNLPAISLPAGLTADGLPVGLQIIGPRHGESLLLAVAARYERARPWPRHCPAAR